MTFTPADLATFQFSYSEPYEREDEPRRNEGMDDIPVDDAPVSPQAMLMTALFNEMNAENERLTAELAAARKEIKALKRKLAFERGFAEFVTEKHGGAE